MLSADERHDDRSRGCDREQNRGGNRQPIWPPRRGVGRLSHLPLYAHPGASQGCGIPMARRQGPQPAVKLLELRIQRLVHR
jgi:hypothetical protein